MNGINKKHQAGITLITSLMMLLTMTILGVTAIKISSVDLLVANNFQQQLAVYQEAETKSRREVNFLRLYAWIKSQQQPPATTNAQVVSKADVVDLERQYPCKGQSDRANSLGPDSPACKIFLFTIDAKMTGTGAKERHYNGSGKQFPNQSNGSNYR